MAITTAVDLSYRKELNQNYDTAVSSVRSALKDQGFGIITEIDIKDTIQKKLGIDFGRNYIILGACNPRLSYEALQEELELGIMLPCNVVVYEEGDHAVVSAINPMAAMGVMNNSALTGVASQADGKMRKALDSLT